MKIRLLSSIIFLCCISVISFAETVQNKSAIPQTIEFAGKQWNKGYQTENKNTSVVEYVTDNETVDNWTRLLTYQRLFVTLPSEITPKIFADKEMENLKNKDYKYSYTVIESSTQEAIIEFKILTAGDQEDEIQRIIKTPDNQLTIFHYGVKKEDMGQAERALVVAALKGIKF